MSHSRKKTGRDGEIAAAQYLINKDMVIIERNWKNERGEIDLIARDGNTLVFVEVKSGRSNKYGPPELRVDIRKQRQIGKVASAYLMQQSEEMDCRFDVVAVSLTGDRYSIKHYEDAFWLESDNG
ncbi:YraN family protein [bacterium]|nr:YraN family protein [bacterium]